MPYISLDGGRDRCGTVVAQTRHCGGISLQKLNAKRDSTRRVEMLCNVMQVKHLVHHMQAYRSREDSQDRRRVKEVALEASIVSVTT